MRLRSDRNVHVSRKDTVWWFRWDDSRGRLTTSFGELYEAIRDGRGQLKVGGSQ